jgi:DNA-binding NarL/FixJ family response regulator
VFLHIRHVTPRERQVLELVAGGNDNRRIANGLFLSDKTVRNHVSNIMAKLDARDRAHAIVRARKAGLGVPSDGEGFGVPPLSVT